jgi:hypothetical protein
MTQHDADDVKCPVPPREDAVEERLRRIRGLRESFNGQPLTEEFLRQAINTGRQRREYVALAGLRPALPSKLFGRKPRLP